MRDVPGGRCGGGLELFAERANLGEFAGEQAGDLVFEGAGADDLAERGVGGERQQVAGDVEGAGLEGAGVGGVVHAGGLGDGGFEGFEHVGADFVVGGEERFDGGGVGGGLRRRELRGCTSRICGSSGSGCCVPDRPSAVSSTNAMAASKERRSMAKGMWARSAMERWPYWK